MVCSASKYVPRAHYSHVCTQDANLMFFAGVFWTRCSIRLSLTEVSEVRVWCWCLVRQLSTLASLSPMSHVLRARCSSSWTLPCCSVSGGMEPCSVWTSAAAVVVVASLHSECTAARRLCVFPKVSVEAGAWSVIKGADCGSPSFQGSSAAKNPVKLARPLFPGPCSLDSFAP